MKSRQIMFFALLEDVEQIFNEIETSINVNYYKAGLLDTDNIPTYNSIFEVPNLGYVLSGDWNRIDTYIILNKEASLNIREVPQKIGFPKFAVDQMRNSKSIELKLGGIYQEKKNVIVAGRIATIAKDNNSEELYKLFSTKVKKAFKKVGAFYVGKMAEEKLKEGWRLVTNEKSQKQYDLTLS